MVGPTEGVDLEGLQKCRLGGEIWRGMQNGGAFGGPAGVEFLHLTSKFWSRGPYRGPHLRCSNANTPNARMELAGRGRPPTPPPKAGRELACYGT
jgi:hypothetical protein